MGACYESADALGGDSLCIVRFGELAPPILRSRASHRSEVSESRRRTGTDASARDDYARTDGNRLRRVAPVEEATRELGVLVRARTSLVEARTAASSQPWAVLAEHWPGAAALF